VANGKGAAMLTDRSINAFAASRGEGLHPKLHALLERASACPLSEVSTRPDGLIQAGPDPEAEIVSSPVNVILFSPRDI
jgi:hypothetical protein